MSVHACVRARPRVCAGECVHVWPRACVILSPLTSSPTLLCLPHSPPPPTPHTPKSMALIYNSTVCLQPLKDTHTHTRARILALRLSFLYTLGSPPPSLEVGLGPRIGFTLLFLSLCTEVCSAANYGVTLAVEKWLHLMCHHCS